MKNALKKRYGQHFLRDTGILDRWERLVRPSSDDLFLEVGAGDGALSTRLARNAGRLLALEIDRDHLPALSAALAAHPNAEVVDADFLKADIELLIASRLGDLRLRVAGNLPYNIGTAIIEKLLLSGLPIRDMTFMLQHEAAARISAAPGCKEYGFMSVFCQHYCDVKLAFRVSAACFVPRPKVTSAVVTMHMRAANRNPEIERNFLLLTKAAFAYRRKKLINSLRRSPALGPIVDELLDQTGADGALRPEDLPVIVYETMAEVLTRRKAQQS